MRGLRAGSVNRKQAGNYLEQHAGWLSTISAISREYSIRGFCLIGCPVIVIRSHRLKAVMHAVFQPIKIFKASYLMYSQRKPNLKFDSSF
jgi:hypothetical protein